VDVGWALAHYQPLMARVASKVATIAVGQDPPYFGLEGSLDSLTGFARSG